MFTHNTNKKGLGNHLILKTLALILPLFLWSCNSTENKVEEAVPEIVEEPVKPTFLYGFNTDSVEINLDTIKKNQNLSEILLKYNIPMSKISELALKSKDVFDVRGLRANKQYEIICDPNDTSHTAKCFIYHPNKVEYVKYDLQDSMHVSMGHFPVDTVENIISGVIETSMYNAMDSAGGSMALAWMLSDVYAWQINFYALQKKDSFKILYSELKVEDEVVGIDKILAAEFFHNGENFQAYWYENEKDSIANYYTETGKSLRKSFLKAPLKFRRISSKFSYSRMHPVFHYRRPHLGVDYAAASGTPVVALGDGKVVKRGRYGQAGNMIKIEHNANYTTGYLHLRNFAKGLTVGKYVKQGEVIGYVGSTGASTGPHLDFRVWKDGKNINPLTMKSPAVKSLTEEEIKEFEVIQKKLVEQLHQTKK